MSISRHATTTPEACLQLRVEAAELFMNGLRSQPQDFFIGEYVELQLENGNVGSAYACLEKALSLLNGCDMARMDDRNCQWYVEGPGQGTRVECEFVQDKSQASNANCPG